MGSSRVFPRDDSIPKSAMIGPGKKRKKEKKWSGRRKKLKFFFFFFFSFFFFLSSFSFFINATRNQATRKRTRTRHDERGRTKVS